MLTQIRKNWKSGLTVALISIPLAISLSLASNASPTAGIISSIVAGILGAALGGSNFNIIGPTGALSGIVASYTLSQSTELLPFLTIMVGIIILIAYLFKFERYLSFVPSSVIQGFTLAVAILLIVSQMNNAFGITTLSSKPNIIENIIQIANNYKLIELQSVFLFSLSIIFLILVKKFKSPIPGIILISPLAILCGYLIKNQFINLDIYTLGDKFKDISLYFSFPKALKINSQLINTAFIVSFIAIVETMLSAKIADKATKTKHNTRKEMFSLAIANIFSGILGGIPATAALARTSANIRSGADHKTSGIISGIIIGLISFFLLNYFRFIPLPVIAAILVMTAVGMIENKHFKRLWKYDRMNFYLSLVVVLIILIADPIIGVLSGVALSFLLFVEKISHGHFELSVNDKSGLVRTMSGDKLKPLKEDGDILIYSIRGNLVTINCQAHLSRFESGILDKYKTIIFRLREVYLIDLDGIETLDEIINLLKNRGINVYLSSISQKNLKKLRTTSHEFIYMENHNLVFDKTSHALQAMGIHTSE